MSVISSSVFLTSLAYWNHTGKQGGNLFFPSLFGISLDFNIDAPPSFKPAKKYSDISGLPVSIFLLSTIAISFLTTQRKDC